MRWYDDKCGRTDMAEHGREKSIGRDFAYILSFGDGCKCNI